MGNISADIRKYVANLKAERDEAKAEIARLHIDCTTANHTLKAYQNKLAEAHSNHEGAKAEIARLTADFNDCNSERYSWNARAETAEAEIARLREALTVVRSRVYDDPKYADVRFAIDAALKPDTGEKP